jgi:Tat protein secretion system quality control protein TatD with DNase activity
MDVPNSPEYLLDTAEVVAQLRGMSLTELAERETLNAYALFRNMK